MDSRKNHRSENFKFAYVEFQQSEPEPFLPSRCHFLRAPKASCQKHANMQVTPFYGVRLRTKLESIVSVVELYFVRCLQSFRVVESPVVLRTRE